MTNKRVVQEQLVQMHDQICRVNVGIASNCRTIAKKIFRLSGVSQILLFENTNGKKNVCICRNGHGGIIFPSEFWKNGPLELLEIEGLLLDHLSGLIAYCQFDLEATKRESKNSDKNK